MKPLYFAAVALMALLVAFGIAKANGSGSTTDQLLPGTGQSDTTEPAPDPTFDNPITIIDEETQDDNMIKSWLWMGFLALVVLAILVIAALVLRR
jgi:hypothetical protein